MKHKEAVKVSFKSSAVNLVQLGKSYGLRKRELRLLEKQPKKFFKKFRELTVKVPERWKKDFLADLKTFIRNN